MNKLTEVCKGKMTLGEVSGEVLYYLSIGVAKVVVEFKREGYETHATIFVKWGEDGYAKKGDLPKLS